MTLEDADLRLSEITNHPKPYPPLDYLAGEYWLRNHADRGAGGELVYRNRCGDRVHSRVPADSVAQ